MVAVSIAVIALPPIGTVYYALLDVATEALGCEQRSLHNLQALGLPALIVGFGLARHTLFRQLRSRRASRSGWALARWASATWLVVLIVVATLPWRVLWDSNYPRILIGTERAYAIVETEEEMLAYTPSTRSVRPYDRDAVDITQLGVIGYVFEEPEVFESGLPRCDAVTQGFTS
jgi:hypothetical protein